ncbi:MAG: peptidylprolyl isomerase, partial [Chthoniobacterales bacterium]
GQFDYEKYRQFVDPNQSNQLAPLGFTEKQIEDLITDSLKLEGIRGLINSQVIVSPAEVSETMKMFQPVDAQVLRINLTDALKNVTASDEDVARVYEENKAQLNTDETRAVEYVKIDLPAGASDLTNKTNLDALQKASDAVTAFVEKARQEGFAAAAKSAGYKVEATPEFTKSGKVSSGTARADLPLAELGPEAFRLESVSSVSDAIQAGNAFYVLALQKVTPSRVNTLEEVRPRIQENIKNDAARKAIEITAQSSVEKIRLAMKEGKTFADAAKGLGLSVQNITGITPASTSQTEERPVTESQTFAASTALLHDGEMGGFEKTPAGGYIVYLVKRHPAEATLEAQQKPQIERFLLRNKEMLLFAEWFRSAQDAASIVLPHRR